MRRFIRLALVASVLYGTGAHWAALRGAAWGGMLATRLSESSWAEAVRSTFSGEKPCHVCKIVEKGSAAEQGPALLRSAPAVDFAMPVAPESRVVLSQQALFVHSPPFGPSFQSAPLVPPPLASFPA